MSYFPKASSSLMAFLPELPLSPLFSPNMPNTNMNNL